MAGNAPVAFINTELDELSTLACVALGLPLITDLNADLFTAIQTGNFVHINEDTGIVEIDSDKQPVPRLTPTNDVPTHSELQLTPIQEEMLTGAQGGSRAERLRLLVEWGESVGTEHLIEVDNALPDGLFVPNRTLGDLPFELIEGYINYTKGCLIDDVEVTATAHASFMDLGREAGVSMTWTCAPHVTVTRVRSQQWPLGSCLNLACFAPRSAVRRLPLKSKPKSPPTPTGDALNTSLERPVGYASRRSSGFPHYASSQPVSSAQGSLHQVGHQCLHIAGITPEVPGLEAALQGHEPDGTVIFSDVELAEVYIILTTATEDEVDPVYFGCPHATLQEVVELAKKLRGKKVHENVTLLISMSYAIEGQARRLGYAQEIEDAGGQVMTDSCPSNSLW